MAGHTISHYRVTGQLGSGGMGVVYKAEDTNLGRTVALKVLAGHLLDSEDHKQRFLQEARTAAALDHPNICTIYEVGESNGQAFLAMAYVDGPEVRSKIKERPLKLDEALDIAIQAAEGLRAAHQKGVVHRDIKSSNLMLTSTGQVKILDFGLAQLTGGTRLTRTDSVLGTPAYMSPEQAQRKEKDRRTDIWSLGVVLYEMATGRLPFDGDSEVAVLHAIINTQHEPVTALRTGVPLELDRILAKTLAKDPDERYQHIDELLVDLRALWKASKAGAAAGRTPARAVSWRVVSAAAAAVLTVAAVWWLGALGGSPIDSLAVLPFVNASNNPDTEYLSEGITESLITGLSRVPRLRVKSRDTVFRYKGQDKDVQEAGKELGVRAVLKGRLAKRGDSLSISAELVDARDGTLLWRERFDRRLADIGAIEHEISKKIFEQLRFRLTGEERRRLTDSYTPGGEAYQHYLRGRYYWNRRTGERLQRAVEEFRQAIERDPNFARAWAGLADCYGVYGFYSLLSPQESLPRGKQAAEKAIQIDETLAEAHASLGWILLQQWHWGPSEREFQRAIELDSGYATARIWYGVFLHTVGRFDEAQMQMERAQELEPLSLIISTLFGWHKLFAGRPDAAIAQLRKTVQLDPSFPRAHWDLGIAYQQKGLHTEAVAEFEKGLELSSDGGVWLGSIANALAVSGKEMEARRVLERLTELSTRQYVSPFEIALVHAGLKERERMYDWLDRAYQDRSTWFSWLKYDPRFTPYRQDPRFQEILRRIGLPE